VIGDGWDKQSRHKATSTKETTMRKWAKRSLVLLSVVAALFLAGRLYYAWFYPFGWSHRCDKGLAMALLNYANNNGGAFPAGELTREASLSLLYPKYSDANELRGKTVPEQVVQAILDKGERLGPDTCGWHYVEGLRIDDDFRLAFAWDKAGLGHNGGRLSGGGHIVVFLDGHTKHVPAAEWDNFLARQNQLFEDAAQKRAKVDGEGAGRAVRGREENPEP
jgi:hypothetical protein